MMPSGGSMNRQQHILSQECTETCAGLVVKLYSVKITIWGKIVK